MSKHRCKDTIINGSRVFQYDNVRDYVYDLENLKHYGNQGHGERFSFTMTHSYEEAVKLAAKGFPDGAQKAKLLEKDISAKVAPTSVINTGQWLKSRVGGSVRVPSYLANRPDCFLQYRQNRETKFLTLLYVGGASASVDAQTLYHKGCMAVALIERLELQGVRCKVVLGYANNDKTELLITLKEFNQSVDIDRLAFWIAHPSAFRRLRFAWYDTVEDSTIREYGNGNGRSTNPRSIKADVVIPCMFAHDGNFSTIESAMEFFRQKLEPLGIKI